MKQHTENEPRPGGNPVHAVLDRLQAVRPTDVDQTVPGAEEQCVAQAGRDDPLSRLFALGHVAEEELTPAEPLGVSGGSTKGWAENDRHLDREIHGATQVAVQRVEAAG